MAISVRFLKLLIAISILSVKVASVSQDTAAQGILHRSPATYEELYNDAMSAYNEQDWPKAVAKYEEAIADWKQERHLTISCRTQCKDAFDANEDRLRDAYSMDYLHYMSQMRNCSKACLTENLGPRFRASKSTRRLFEDREPYSFLQYSYFKVGNATMAAKAASTFLRFSPKDSIVKENLKFYGGLPELKDVDVTELESLDPVQHHELYEKGRKAYNAEKWQETVNYFEEALKEYVKAYKECQILCDIDVENTQQYIPGGVYGYHLQMLYCRLDCPRQLSRLFNYPQRGHLSKHYDFLQYSYTQLKRTEEAIKCAVTYELLNPASEHMKNNLAYYEKLGFSTSAVEPREEGQYLYDDIRKQMQLSLDVKAYLLELDEEYKGGENLEDNTYEAFLSHGLFPDEQVPKIDEKESEQDEKNEEPSKKRKQMDDEPYKSFPPPTREHIENVLKTTKEFEGLSLVMMEQQLNGSHRVVIDGVATEQQCKELMDMGLTIGHAGDGYGDKPSPHTVKEKFLGVNVKNATWAAAKGEISLEKAELYVNLSEKVRRVTEAYFQLTTPLYFSYTHLVCREALADGSHKGMHISHPIHSDNCILKNGKNVTCVKESPAYTWRDYSAILYLNGEFTGGQFVFAAPNQTIEAIVKPTCGRMVAFSAGFENLHGVLGIKEGTRCALPVWFTLDKKHRETQREDVDEILRNLRDSDKSGDSDHNEL